MTGLELKLARETLGLSQYEAAEHIGKVHQRSWAFWESGRNAIKNDVVATVEGLLERRRLIIREFYNQQEIQPIIYYNSPEYCQSYLDWKFSQSLARTLAIDFNAELVEFDKRSFDEFCAGFKMEDTPATRSEWAVYQNSAKENG